MAVAVVVGTVIGSGVFKMPQTVASACPYFGLAALAWVLGGVLALLGSLALAEVAVLYPQAGGNYVYLREGFGRLTGFLWGWVEFWIIRAGSIAALASVFAESLHDVLKNAAFRQLFALAPSEQALTGWEQRGLTVAVILGLAAVNVRGVRWGGGLQLFITLVKVGSLLAILVLPFVANALAASTFEPAQPSTANLAPLWPTVWNWDLAGGFGTALLGILFAYHGWMNIAPVAGEVRDPQRNLPLAFLAGTGIVIFLYLGANLAYALIMPAEDMARHTTTTVATVFSQRLLGPLGGAAASAAVMCSAFGALNGNLLVGPRLVYAMGQDGLAPKAVSAIHPRWHTPAVAILLQAAWAALLVVLAGLVQSKKPIYNSLTDYAMFGAIVFETLAVATIFVFRKRRPDAERSYSCWGHPWVAILYVAIMVPVVANTFWKQQTEALAGVGFMLVGAFVYLLIARLGSRSRFIA